MGNIVQLGTGYVLGVWVPYVVPYISPVQHFSGWLSGCATSTILQILTHAHYMLTLLSVRVDSEGTEVVLIVTTCTRAGRSTHLRAMEQRNVAAGNSSYLTINGTNVTIQALPMTHTGPCGPIPTPRSSREVIYSSMPSHFLIAKVLIECVSKENKESKTF